MYEGETPSSFFSFKPEKMNSRKRYGMVLMIRKNLQNACARIFTTGALFVCGSLISAVPTYATTGGASNAPAGIDPALVSSYTDKELTGEQRKFNLHREGILIDKSLQVRNIANTFEFTPSAPDVKFIYSPVYNNPWYQSMKEFDAVAKGEDSQGTKFDIYRGPQGGLVFGSSVKDGSREKYELLFKSDDTVENGKVTKTFPVSIDGTYFKRPGVYRYIIMEKMEEVDFSESDKEAAKVTDDIELRPTLLDRDGKITNTENRNLEEKRFLDVYVEWTITEKSLQVTDVVLHDIPGDLIYTNLPKDGVDQIYSRPEFNGDGTIKRDKDGYIVYQGDEEANTYADPYNPESILSSSKKTGFSDSIYTTYDLVVGKEIAGKGLTNYDIKERRYKFEISIEAPANTALKSYAPARQATYTPEKKDYRTDAKNGTLTITVELPQNEYVLISGLPSGATYNVKEISNEKDARSNEPDTLEVFEIYFAKNLDNMLITDKDAAGDLYNRDTTRANRTTRMMTLQGAYASAAGNGALNAAQEESVGLYKVKNNKDASTGKLAVQKMTPEESNPVAAQVNNVFFLNLRYDNVTTGVAMSVAPYAVMLGAGIIAVTGFKILKKRHDDEDDLDEM